MSKNSHTSLLDRLTVTSPCSEDWDSMTGNEQVRFCSHCVASVHNLSEMTRIEAMALVRKSQGRLCVRYYRRPDGVIQTATESLHSIKRRASRIAAGAFTATLSLCASTPAQTPSTAVSSTSSGVEIVKQSKNAQLAKQGLSGVLAGTVTDPQEAVIPGANVTLIDEKTNREQTTTTDDEGAFKFQSLPAGIYTLKVKSEFFAASETTGIYLPGGQERRVDTSLEPARMLMGAVMIVEPNDFFVKAAYQDDLAAVKELIATGVDVNVKDKDIDSTALMQAVGNGNHEMVQVLLSAGADVNLKTDDGRTALMMLGEKTTAETVWALVSAGAKVNRKDEDGDTPLIIAARVDNSPALQALLNAGAKMNAKNKEGETALMTAVGEGYLQNVKVLLEAGADVNRKNEDGETALSLARENDSPEIVKLLEAYGARE